MRTSSTASSANSSALDKRHRRSGGGRRRRAGGRRRAFAARVAPVQRDRRTERPHVRERAPPRRDDRTLRTSPTRTPSECRVTDWRIEIPSGTGTSCLPIRPRTAGACPATTVPSCGKSSSAPKFTAATEPPATSSTRSTAPRPTNAATSSTPPARASASARAATWTRTAPAEFFSPNREKTSASSASHGGALVEVSPGADAERERLARLNENRAAERAAEIAANADEDRALREQVERELPPHLRGQR